MQVRITYVQTILGMCENLYENPGEVTLLRKVARNLLLYVASLLSDEPIDTHEFDNAAAAAEDINAAPAVEEVADAVADAAAAPALPASEGEFSENSDTDTDAESFVSPAAVEEHLAAPISETAAPVIVAPIPEPVAEAAPVAAGAAADAIQDNLTTTTCATTSKRDFTRWVNRLQLPHGHLFWYCNESFKLVLKDGKAFLTRSFPDCSVIQATSPSGILKAHIKKKLGKDRALDGWKKLCMYTEDAHFYNIGWNGWLKRTWNSETNRFVVKND